MSWAGAGIIYRLSGTRRVGDGMGNDNAIGANHTDPKVSIVIPAYNVERYFEECLSSIEGQSYRNL